jgi:hypothetical protein
VKIQELEMLKAVQISSKQPIVLEEEKKIVGNFVTIGDIDH